MTSFHTATAHAVGRQDGNLHQFDPLDTSSDSALLRAGINRESSDPTACASCERDSSPPAIIPTGSRDSTFLDEMKNHADDEFVVRD
jgi:hypothetical protein